ncbi:hypothetical protein TWF191_001453 [Orbilia oligospora]|uniref:Uncharacterized protein n=1 Tax=Orbilia oligospora TaxID=2813651 RepID=A0A7C8QDM5_ORBOL|nr:hypothetical protein TWF191_001453 [Orbilia oligospora]
MAPLDIDEGLPLDEDDNIDNGLHKKEHCYCDPCTELTGEDGRMIFGIYHNIMFLDKNTPPKDKDNSKGKDKDKDKCNRDSQSDHAFEGRNKGSWFEDEIDDEGDDDEDEDEEEDENDENEGGRP